MSPNRRTSDPEDPFLVRSLALRLPDGQVLEPHTHPWGQIVYATEGVLTVEAEGGAWVVPSLRAVWIPAGVRHGLQATGRVRLRTLYLGPGLGPELPETCHVLSVSPLLRELVLETIRRGMLRADRADEARLAHVIVDQLRDMPQAALELPWPRDPRARRCAERMCEQLEAAHGLEHLALGSGASARTLERLFTRETGLSFGRWRQRARLLHALRLLASGESVTETAMSVGFASTSAFVAMFRRALGRTPGRYFRAAEEA